MKDFVGYTKKVESETKTSRRKTKKLKKMNCNPSVENKKLGSHTCYTHDVMLKIRDEYNKGHEPSLAIKTDDSNEIWRILKDRLVNCKKEDCWLQVIQDKQLSQEIDDYIFAPDAPPEWKKNPNEWLTNFDIMHVMEDYGTPDHYPEFLFLGPSPIDFDAKSSVHQCVENDICHLSLQDQWNQKKTKIT